MYYKSFRILINAVINKTAKELSDYYPDYEKISALYDDKSRCEALGTACRFCGAETVKILVEQYGVNFFEDDRKKESSIFQFYLLKIFDRGEYKLKGSDLIKYTPFRRRIRYEGRKYRRFLPDKERIEILRYLCQKGEQIGFNAGDVLYYAYLSCDNVVVSELKKIGVRLSEKMTRILTKGENNSNSFGSWSEFCLILSYLDPKDAVNVLKDLYSELSGEKFYYSKIILDIANKFPNDAKLFDFILGIIDNSKINKTQYLRELIDANSLECLSVAADHGWLNYPKRRDEMISYSTEHDRTECTAFLLDYKNRTADLAAERAKAEKKLERELNAAPDSVLMLRQIWSYKKRDDGTLIITRYKGSHTVVTVPEKIGRSVVTAIDSTIFTPVSSKNNTFEIRGNVTEIHLPDSINEIRPRAFCNCVNLQSVNIPDGVSEIGEYMFQNCRKLGKIDLPNSVRLIDYGAFSNCKALKKFAVPEGVEKIVAAFNGCLALKTLVLPRSLKEISEGYYSAKDSIFGGSSHVNFIVPRGSFAEKYCKSRKAAFIYTEEYNGEHK